MTGNVLTIIIGQSRTFPIVIPRKTVMSIHYLKSYIYINVVHIHNLAAAVVVDYTMMHSGSLAGSPAYGPSHRISPLIRPRSS